MSRPPETGTGGVRAARVMVVDDEESICAVLAQIMRRDGYEVESYTDSREALEAFRRHPADVVVHDLKMPHLSGLSLLSAIKGEAPETICIVITAYDTWNSAVEAMRRGAYSYIKKPFDNDDIRAVVARAWEQRRLISEGGAGEERVTQVRNMVGNNAVIRDIDAMIRRVAPTDSTVLVTGENGTGKELIARAIHQLSLRKYGAFIALNCGGLTDSLLESELFGHVRGAFTGAIADKRGYFEAAHGGTLFMDEIGEMSLATQVKVLRVLEEREVTPVGSASSRRVDVRIVAATNRDLEEEVARGRMREDLYYRLNVIPICIPPLRERRDDIPALAGYFLAACAERNGKLIEGIDRDAMEALVRHDWPGNVRELQNVVERAVTLCSGSTVTLGDLGSRHAARAPSGTLAFTGEIPEGGMDLEAELVGLERAYMRLALERCGWNQTRAAEVLSMTFRAFRYKMKKYGLREEVPHNRPG